MDNGEVMSWGSCLHGILGIGETSENQYFPIKVLIESEHAIEAADINVGKNHAALVIKNRNST